MNFKGQKRFCSRCREDHVGQCPVLKEFYAAKDKRQEMEREDKIKTKIFSDSTLRSVNALGLRADVCAMSGGGLGQVIQASLDDPTTAQYDNIVIVGGTNDMKHQNFRTNEAFAENIDRSLDKLKAAAVGDSSKNILLLKLSRQRGEGHIADRDEVIRQVYLATKIKDCAKEVPNIKATTVRFDTDPTGHPNDIGTAQILNHLNNRNIAMEPLIWNAAYMVSESIYKGVDSIYRYGCNLCDRFGADCKREQHANQLVCDVCLDSFTEGVNPTLDAIVERVNDEFIHNYNEDFPNNPNKRRRANDVEENQGEKIQNRSNDNDGESMDESV